MTRPSRWCSGSSKAMSAQVQHILLCAHLAVLEQMQLVIRIHARQARKHKVVRILQIRLRRTRRARSSTLVGVDNPQLHNRWWVDRAAVGCANVSPASPPHTSHSPLPPTPHMRACLGCWRTMSSYCSWPGAIVVVAEARGTRKCGRGGNQNPSFYHPHRYVPWQRPAPIYRVMP